MAADARGAEGLLLGLRIAERWFERRGFADGVTLLFEPHVDPWIRCNIWHVAGRDADLLVDTGLGLASLREAARDLFDKPVHAVATHVHFDHAGGLHEFEMRVIHAAEAARLSDYREVATLDGPELDRLLHGAVTASGDTLPGLLIDALPFPGFEAAHYRVLSTRPTRTVVEGDVIDLGDRHLEVLHLPGHTPGSIGLWEPASATLFSGDAIYDGPLLDALPESDRSAYVHTMKRLRELPVSVVHAGHEPSFGRARLHTLVDAYLARRDV